MVLHHSPDGFRVGLFSRPKAVIGHSFLLTLVTWSRFAFLAAGATVALTGPTANAQRPLPNSTMLVNPAFRVNPNMTLQQFAFNNTVAGRAISQFPPWAFGFNPYPASVYAPSYNPFMATAANYGGGSGSMYATSGYSTSGSSYDPYGGSVLRGAADIVGAQGRFAVTMEQSKVIQEQRRQTGIDTRRKIFDEWQYERANTPTAEAFREQEQRLARRRALNDPPETEIWSGLALNTLLDHMRTLQGGRAKAPSVALDEETLKHINLTSGSGGNIGLLKNGGFLTWPLALKGDDFKDERIAISQELAELVQQATAGNRVDAGTLTTTKKNLETLHEKLAKNVGEIGTSQYIESKRYLNLLNDGLRALGDDDVANYFNQKFAGNGKTAAEMVEYMSDKGLRFAPSTSGDEAAYRALYLALALYDVSLTQNVVEKDK
jgi:hypothetical protein